MAIQLTTEWPVLGIHQPKEETLKHLHFGQSAKFC